LYILTFTFQDSRREDKRFRTEVLQALPDFNLLLISSWTQFLFVSVILNYLNCVTFLNFQFAIFMSWFWHVFWWRVSNIQVC
jgi:hypothetical protein